MYLCVIYAKSYIHTHLYIRWRVLGVVIHTHIRASGGRGWRGRRKRKGKE